MCNVHCRVELNELNAVPKGAPSEPRLIFFVDDECRIYGVPVVALFTRGYQTTLVAPVVVQRVAEVEGRGGGEADSRCVATERRA